MALETRTTMADKDASVESGSDTSIERRDYPGKISRFTKYELITYKMQ